MTSAELHHIVWQQLGERVPLGTTKQQLHDLLHYRLMPAQLPSSPVNPRRDEIIQFINQNVDRLSLPCNGNCYQHSDGQVLFCYEQLRGVDE